MPKITSKPWRIAGQDYALNIYYSSKKGFYLQSGLPPEIEVVLGSVHHRVSGEKTEDDLNAAIKLIVAEYEEKIKNNRLVLIINGYFSDETIKLLGLKYDQDSAKRHPFNPNYRGGDGHGFNIKFCVCREFSVGAKKDYRHRNATDAAGTVVALGGSYFRPGPDSIIIEYTEERAQFLLRLAEATKDIAQKLADFFTKDEAKMIDNMEVARLNPAQQILLN